MGAFNFVWLFLLIPTTGLLTVSFFVLFTLQKVESKRLKSFGRVIAMLLWICATIVFLTAIYTASMTNSGFCPLKSSCFGLRNPHKSMMLDPHHGIQTDPHHQFMMEEQPEVQK